MVTVLKLAENLIKEQFIENIDDKNDDISIDLEGMECRWNEIKPNSEEKKVICLLVMCNNEEKQAEVYTTIMDEIDYIFWKSI